MEQNLGQKLKQVREAKGLSYYRVSKDTGMSISMLHRLEDGRGRAINAIKLAQYLGVSLTD
jgi:Helix-turn-helix.